MRLLPRPLRVCSTLWLVMIGWIFFRAPDLTIAAAQVAAHFGSCGGGTPTATLVAVDQARVAIALASLGLALFGTTTWRQSVELGRARALATAVLLAVCVIIVSGNVNSPFLYFQF